MMSSIIRTTCIRWNKRRWSCRKPDSNVKGRGATYFCLYLFMVCVEVSMTLIIRHNIPKSSCSTVWSHNKRRMTYHMMHTKHDTKHEWTLLVTWHKLLLYTLWHDHLQYILLVWVSVIIVVGQIIFALCLLLTLPSMLFDTSIYECTYSSCWGLLGLNSMLAPLPVEQVLFRNLDIILGLVQVE